MDATMPGSLSRTRSSYLGAYRLPGRRHQAGLGLRAARAAAVGATIVILQAVPLLIHDNSHVPAVIAHALPFQAWTRLTAIPFNLVARAYPWTITGAWTVFAVWRLAAAVLAVAAVQRRDV
jgi:hypothetical protein